MAWKASRENYGFHITSLALCRPILIRNVDDALLATLVNLLQSDLIKNQLISKLKFTPHKRCFGGDAKEMAKDKNEGTFHWPVAKKFSV